MSYSTVADVKTYLDVTGTGDDGLIASMLTAATSAIDTYTGRLFNVQSNTIRYFDSEADVQGLTLHLDHDLCEIDSITNGDGTTVTSAQYVTNPRNDTPYYSIKLKSSYSLWWEDDDNGDSEDAIAISGKWGYSQVPPDDIEKACLRLASFYYRQKDAQVYDITITPELGQLTIPQGIPADVRMMLNRYRRA